MWNQKLLTVLLLFMGFGWTLPSWGQTVAPEDSLALMGILKKNCHNCGLEIPGPGYWDTLQPVSAWPGVGIKNGRIDTLSLTFLGLTGELASLGHCTELEQLNCSLNYLTGLNDSLRYCSKLKSLKTAFNDSLLRFPSFDNFVALVEFDGGTCSKITHLPSLDNCVALQQLRCGDMNLTALPSLENCPDLQWIECHNNQLTELPSMSHLLSLEILRCNHNKLSQLPTLETCRALRILDCKNNFLNTLNGLPQTASLHTLHCGHNLLDFSHLEAFTHLGTFSYSPQGNPALSVSDSLPALPGRLLDATPFGGEHGIYQWYFHPFFQPDTNSQTSLPITVSPLSITSSGWYQCVVTNTIAPNLTLITLPVFLEVSEGVRCGDSNRDDLINILDLALIGLNYGETGPPRTGDLPNDTSLQASFIWRDTSGNPRNYDLHGETLNLKHADCNGDGLINEFDLTCIQSYYNHPHTPPRYLQNAENPEMQLLAQPRIKRIEVEISDTDTLIRVPYNIN